jgi:hypothetical protein
MLRAFSSSLVQYFKKYSLLTTDNRYLEFLISSSIVCGIEFESLIFERSHQICMRPTLYSSFTSACTTSMSSDAYEMNKPYMVVGCMNICRDGALVEKHCNHNSRIKEKGNSIMRLTLAPCGRRNPAPTAAVYRRFWVMVMCLWSRSS